MHDTNDDNDAKTDYSTRNMSLTTDKMRIPRNPDANNVIKTDSSTRKNERRSEVYCIAWRQERIVKRQVKGKMDRQDRPD